MTSSITKGVQIISPAGFDTKNFWLPTLGRADSVNFEGQTSLFGGLVLGRQIETFAALTVKDAGLTYTYIGNWTIDVTAGKRSDHVKASGSYDSVQVTKDGMLVAQYGGSKVSVNFGTVSGDVVPGLGINASSILPSAVDLLFGDLASSKAFAGLNLNATPTLTDFALKGGATFNGNFGNDVLRGSRFDDVLDGRYGVDSMVGGAGNDTYIVETKGDRVVEFTREGTDLVRASIDYSLTANVENLTLTGNADIDGTGNDLNNILAGNNGDNRLLGGAGNDRLYGMEGRDTLDGGIGNDIMAGGTGNDTYVVDSARDKVSELADQGIDTVRASTSFTLRANVENLTLTGTGNFVGKGNALDNSIMGNDGSNKLFGGDGSDRLEGGAGNDRLNGGTGADVLKGGTGNDTYIVDNFGDKVVESANSGIDIVRTSISYTLDEHVENGTLTGNAIAYLRGNDLDNTLVGNSGSNMLYGGLGKDILTGGAEADQFSFKSIYDSSVGIAGRDVIKDFDRAEMDRIDLRDIDANMFDAGNQQFDFIGTNGFSKHAGELQMKFTGNNTFIQGDVNGDGKADFSIQVVGHHELDSGAFIL